MIPPMRTNREFLRRITPSTTVLQSVLTTKQILSMSVEFTASSSPSKLRVLPTAKQHPQSPLEVSLSLGVNGKARHEGGTKRQLFFVRSWRVHPL